jgi:coniferyl-aldehyde dehydrogenase
LSSTIEEAITYVRNRSSPLALYYFGSDFAEERLVIDGTTSGGVTINDCISHYSICDEKLSMIVPAFGHEMA